MFDQENEISHPFFLKPPDFPVLIAIQQRAKSAVLFSEASTA
jgi:hypothetical protein